MMTGGSFMRSSAPWSGALSVRKVILSSCHAAKGKTGAPVALEEQEQDNQRQNGHE
jgi:hypothetical protein